MIKGPGDLPEVDSLPGTNASIRLSVHHPAGGRAARDRLRKALLARLQADAERFDEALPEMPWPGEFPGEECVVLLRKSFAKSALFKGVRFGPCTDARTTVTVDYAGAAEDNEADTDDMAAAIAACCLAVLCELQELTHEDLGPGCLPALRARFFGVPGGWIFSGLLRLRLLDVPIVALAPDSQRPDGFLQGAEALLGGHALVAELADAEAVAELADAFGQEMACPDGGARIYQPGWSEDDDPGLHPAWSRQQILPKGEGERFAEFAFCNEVFRELFVRPRERDRERIGELERQVARLAGRVAVTAAALGPRKAGPKRGGGKGRRQGTKRPPTAGGTDKPQGG